MLYEYRHLIEDVFAVCSSTSYHSWYPLLLALMLVFDGGIHNDPEFQILLLRTDIIVNCLFSVDGDTICVSWLIGQAHDRTLIAAITTGRELCYAVVSQL